MVVMAIYCARLEMKNGEPAATIKRERQVRAAAERELAVLAAVQAARPGPGSKSKRGQGQQGALWQGESGTPDGATGTKPAPRLGD